VGGLHKTGSREGKTKRFAIKAPFEKFHQGSKWKKEKQKSDWKWAKVE